MCCVLLFFFFKQKTAYEMRISDWSSDVCSSDLLADLGCPFARTTDGKIDQRFFGAHTYRRTCYAGDWTGRAIVRALGRRVSELGVPEIGRASCRARVCQYV